MMARRTPADQRPKKGGAETGAVIRADVVRSGLANPHWFHVVRDAAGRVQINVNTARVPCPSRTLVATHTAVHVEGSKVSLVFGQVAPGARVYTGAMVVVLSSKNARRAISFPDFQAALATYAQQHGIEPTIREPEPDRYPEERIVTDLAAIVAIAFADDDAELRFFRVSPTDLRALQHEGAQVELLYPVVQILMHTSELVHLVHTIDQLTEVDPEEQG